MDHGRSYQKTNTDKVCRPESIEARELIISEERAGKASFLGHDAKVYTCNCWHGRFRHGIAVHEW